MLEGVLVPAIVFYSMYAIIRELLNYLTKRRLIMSGNIRANKYRQRYSFSVAKV